MDNRALASSRPAPLFIISGPSGTGKTTLIRQLLADPPCPLRLAVSVTTRKPRPTEQDGVDYHFWPRERFEQELKADAFLEWADVYGYGNYYGTLHSEVDPVRAAGTGVVLEIDVQGWQQVKRHCPDAVAIFIRTSSLATYEKRLRLRGTETEEAIQKRLQGAERELARAPEYEYQVTNDDLHTALITLKAIVEDCFRRSR
jgi:guanylate kinase